MKKYVPDILSGMRIAGALAMIFQRAFSVPFYVLYVFCGVSDIADGFFARKFNAQLETGAMLDSAAEYVCYFCEKNGLKQSVFTLPQPFYVCAV